MPHVETPDQVILVGQSLRGSNKVGVEEYAVDFGVGSPLNVEQVEKQNKSLKTLVIIITN